MQRMRRNTVPAFAVFALVAFGFLGSAARADLIHPDDKTKFPDISGGFVSGTAAYSAATGMFQVQNIPFALALGMGPTDSYEIQSTDAGLRSEVLSVQLDDAGKMVAGSVSDFTLFGKVTIGAQTFSGQLLKGKVHAGVGSLDLSKSPTNIAGAAMFDLDLQIDKSQSLLGQAFSGGYAYLRLMVEKGSTFDGSFTKDFSGYKVSSNLRAYEGLPPAPVPEPTTLVVLVAAGAGLLFHRRRKISRAELEPARVA
ncbi:MAG: PEP-CTERM sorting domain-containing protein [Isosphaeraceae bacterium]|nr:PEP-CTERM sorting domain-containing protein [Isosphaeraceae bacterium]